MRKNPINSEALVIGCTTYGYKMQILDGYGNSTKWIKVNDQQLDQITKILSSEKNN